MSNQIGFNKISDDGYENWFSCGRFVPGGKKGGWRPMGKKNFLKVNWGFHIYDTCKSSGSMDAIQVKHGNDMQYSEVSNLIV